MKTKLTNWGEAKPGERTTNKAVSFYPNHIAIIEAFAKRERRTFSNAVQVIVEQWYDANVEDFVHEAEAA